MPGAPALDRLHNLPSGLTSFVAREREVVEVRRLLGTTRLLTLTGAGRVGKTRLGIEAARGVVAAYPDGVWLVELAGLAEPALVTQAVATALGVREWPDRQVETVLADYVRLKRLLLVLDNCEHLVGACAALADRLLRAGPDLRLLTTSREPLGLAGETIWRVPSLSVPAETAGRLEVAPAAGRGGATERRNGSPLSSPEVGGLLEYGGVRLFVERAAAVAPGFALTRQNAPAVVQVCRRLDGIPLAIELAAARVRLLTPDQIAARLDDRFRLLTGGSRMALLRHQTLRGTIDWSYELLSEPERALFRRLSVFAGGWSLEAAEAVCAEQAMSLPSRSQPGDLLELLGYVVDKSLVVAERQAAEARYGLLETIRQYAAEKLDEAGETSALRRRHLDWCLALAERAERGLTGAEQAVWLGRLEAEHDNLRAALDWAVERRDAGAGLRLAGALWRFWWLHGYLTEGRQRLTRLLALPSQSADDAARAKALNSAGLLAIWQGDYTAARGLLDEGLGLGCRAGDQEGIAWALLFLGRIARDQGDAPGARAQSEEAVAIFRQLGDDWALGFALHFLVLAREMADADAARAAFEESVARFRSLGDRWSTAMGLRGLGLVAHQRAEYAEARRWYEQSLALFEERGDLWPAAMLCHDLGYVALAERDLERAGVLFRRALARWWELGNRRGCALALVGLAAVAAATGQAARAGRLFGAADAAYSGIEAVLEPTAREQHRAGLAAARAAEPAAFDAAFADGRALVLDRVVDEERAAETGSPAVAPEGPPDPLTRRERQVAALVAAGLSNRDIADQLAISERTAEAHLEHIRTKLGLRSRAQIAAWAVEQGLKAAI
jgi:predicted ATPase/DNA-binding CsgD family transcriptional regulator